MEEKKSNPLKRRVAAKLIIFVAVSAIFVAISGAKTASAASLYFSSTSDTRYVGRTFTVNVYVSSPDQAMNAAQGTVSFPVDKLEVVSLSKSGSVVTLWVQEPSFSNREGTIDFGGVVVNPGFQGGVGKILSITFRAKSTGQANLSFSSASVLANDGKGTNILSYLGSTSIALSEAPPGTVATEVKAPSTLAILSNPTVNDNVWYNIDSIEFSWKIPAGTEGVDYDIANTPDYQLSETDRGLVSKASYDLKQFNDGIWYFFVRLKNKNGWEPMAIKSFQLDRTPPEPFAITRQDSDWTNPRPTFFWQATDKASGVAYYRIKIGEGDYFNPESIRLATVAAVSYVLPPQSPAASRTLIVRAYDKAGNFREAAINFPVFSPNSWYAYWYKFTGFFSQYGWLLSIIIFIFVIALYFLIYRLIRWRRGLKTELKDFKDELRRDLKRLEEQIESDAEKGLKIDLRPSRLQKTKEALQKEAEHIEEDVKKEVKKLDEFTGE